MWPIQQAAISAVIPSLSAVSLSAPASSIFNVASLTSNHQGSGTVIVDSVLVGTWLLAVSLQLQLGLVDKRPSGQ